MNAQPQAAPAVDTPALKIVSSDELLARVLASEPSLQEVAAELKLVIGVWVELIDTPTPVSQSDMLMLLESLFQADPNAVRRAVTEINKRVSVVNGEFAQLFQERTGTPLDPATLDIEKRYRDEIDEQNSLEAQARELLAKVAAVVNKLGLQDLYAQKKAALLEKANAAAGKKAKDTKPAPWEALQQRLTQVAIERGLAKVTPSEEVEPTVVDHPIVADWQTPPILNPDNPQYVELVKRLDGVLALMRLTEAKSPTNMKDVVLARLANTPTKPDVLEQIMEALSEFANQQLVQSQVAKQTVSNERQVFMARVQALKYVMSIYGAVGQAFAPARR